MTGLGCLDHGGDRRRDPGNPGRSRNAPPSPQPNEWIPKSHSVGGRIAIAENDGPAARIAAADQNPAL